MATNTTNYALRKPAQDDFYNVDDFNYNSDIIDEELKANKDSIKSNELALAESTGQGVLNGLKAKAQTVPDMTLEVEAGTVYMADGTRVESYGILALVVNAADIANPRKDIVYVDKFGTIKYSAGMPNISPTPPITPEGAFLIAEMNIAANATTITDADIVDKRKMKVTTESLSTELTTFKEETISQMADSVNKLNTHKTESMPHLHKIDTIVTSVSTNETIISLPAEFNYLKIIGHNIKYSGTGAYQVALVTNKVFNRIALSGTTIKNNVSSSNIADEDNGSLPINNSTISSLEIEIENNLDVENITSIKARLYNSEATPVIVYGNMRNKIDKISTLTLKTIRYPHIQYDAGVIFEIWGR